MKEALAIVSRIFVFLSNFGIVMLNLHFAGMEGQGIISLLNTGILLCATLSAFIGGGAIVYLLPRSQPGKIIGPSVVWTFISALITAVILFVLDTPAAGHAVLLGLLQSVFIIHQMFLLGQNRAIAYQWMILFQGLMSVSLTWFFYFISPYPSFSDYIMALYFSFAATNIFGFYLTKDIWRQWKASHIADNAKPLWQYGKYTQAGNILHLANQRSYLFLLEKSSIEGTLLAGVFSVLLYIGEGLWSVAKSLSAIQGAAISQNEDHKEHRVLTKKYLMVSMIATIAGTGVFLMLPDSWLDPFLDGKTAMVTQAFYYIIPGILLNTSTIILAHYFSGKGFHRFNAYSALAGVLTTVALAPWFIRLWGLSGGAAALSVSFGIQTIVQWIYYFKAIKEVNLRSV